MLDEAFLSWIYDHWSNHLGLRRHDLDLQRHLVRAHLDHLARLFRHENHHERELRLWNCVKGKDVSCPFYV